jgi:hypothetical protein
MSCGANQITSPNNKIQYFKFLITSHNFCYQTLPLLNSLQTLTTPTWINRPFPWTHRQVNFLSSWLNSMHVTDVRLRAVMPLLFLHLFPFSTLLKCNVTFTSIVRCKCVSAKTEPSIEISTPNPATSLHNTTLSTDTAESNVRTRLWNACRNKFL